MNGRIHSNWVTVNDSNHEAQGVELRAKMSQQCQIDSSGHELIDALVNSLTGRMQMSYQFLLQVEMN